MGLDLRDGLRDLVEDPRVEPAPVPVADVAARVRRGRARRWARVGLAGVSAAAVVGVAGFALGGGGPEPVPPADPTPMPSEPADATPAPLPSYVSMVLMQPDGTRHLVLVDDVRGVERTLLVDPGLMPGTASMVPGGEWVYTTRASEDGTSEVLRVSTEDGAVEVLAEGRMPAVSPDGTTLTYVGRADEPDVATLVVADLDGTVRRVIADEAYDVERGIDPVVWLHDGRMLVGHWFSAGLEMGGTLKVLDDGTPSIQAGEDFGPEGYGLRHAMVLPDGDVVVAAWSGTASPEADDYASLLRLDGTTGEVVDQLLDPVLYAGNLQEGPTRFVAGIVPDPDGAPLVLVHQWSDGVAELLLHRWTDGGLEQVATW